MKTNCQACPVRDAEWPKTLIAEPKPCTNMCCILCRNPWVNSVLLLINVDVTRPYVCQHTPTYGDTSDKLYARFYTLGLRNYTFSKVTRTLTCIMPSAHGPIFYRRQNIRVKIGSCTLNFGLGIWVRFNYVLIGKLPITRRVIRRKIRSCNLRLCFTYNSWCLHD